MKPRAAKRAGGFSLLEVIAAILLLAIAFTALMRVTGGSIELTNNAADYTRAALWAHSLLDTVDAEGPLKPGHTEGRFNQQYRWRLTVTPWTPVDVDPQQQLSALALTKLDLDVLWGQGRSERSAHFSTLRLTMPPNGPQ
ncbi:prepilin-type N-terminal cleavage/methylation domain-containing protein [Dyella sp. 2RAB6]|uniref:prepilin-type N-terminal cleavage/methylation domain-containing protein n=1 Tax=Dyella sp. 2RAB6 TaxID=3232992 RepID=UPI003F8E3370